MGERNLDSNMTDIWLLKRKDGSHSWKGCHILSAEGKRLQTRIVYTQKRSFKQFFFPQYIKALHLLPENKLKEILRGVFPWAFVVYVWKCRKSGERTSKYARNIDYKNNNKIIVIRVILWGLGFNWMTLLTWKAKKDFQGITMIETLALYWKWEKY